MSTRHVVSAVQTFIDELDDHLITGHGMWLMGTTGTGKTTLGMLISQAAIAAGKTVAVYFAPRLLTEIRQTYEATDSEDAYDAFFKRLTSVDLLYIDDLGSERHTDWVVEQLYAIVNERYETQQSMLITSNADPDVAKKEVSPKQKKAEEEMSLIDLGLQQLRGQIGVRTVSRLIEICGDPQPLFGPDQRELSAARLPS